MNNGEAIKIINQYDMNFHWNDGEPIPASQLAEAFDLAISALKKQEQSCDTCRHGRFGDGQCDNCGVRYPNHYEAEEES